MYRRILVPIDLADVELAKPAIATALMMAKESNGSIRLVNVLPTTPVMLAEYVPPDFEAQQRASAEEAIAIVAKETGLAADKFRPPCFRAMSIAKSSTRPRRCAPT